MKKNPQYVVKPAGQLKWEAEFSVNPDLFHIIYCIPFKVMRSTELQSFQYRVLNRIIFCNKWLHKMNIKDRPTCDFCTAEDNITHFFIDCPNT